MTPIRPGSTCAPVFPEMAMRIGILGPLDIRNHLDEPCLPQGAKQRLLLALLLVHAPKAVSTDRLVEGLWGGRLPRDPAASLRTQISRLRACLVEAGGDDALLQHVPTGYRLATAGVEVDAERFTALLMEARELSPRTGDDPDASPGALRELELLEQALHLWRGDPYEEFLEFSTFLGTSRMLREAWWGARERRAELLLELDRVGAGLAEAERLMREDPLRERPRVLAMRSLYRAGRAHEALAVYQEYRLLLSEELGLDPSPALRELEGAILRHEAGSGTGGLHPGGVEPGRAPGAALPGESGTSRIGPSAPAAAAPEPVPRQSIRFCRTRDGVRLAYATVGSGPPLVKAANWLNDLDFDWESPVWRRLFRELAGDRTLIRYDERGSGLSDRDPPEQSLERWVEDLEAIVDACGLERFPLLGISQGCAVSIEYAARHPERVSGLVLHGGYAAGWRANPDHSPADVARRDASIQIVRHGWGEDTPAYRQMFTLTFIPGGTREEIEWFNELERRTVSPEGAVRFMEAFAEIDVRHRLADVRAPTLVLHSRGDQRIHHEQGRELAAGIPGARFVLLESANHLILEHEPAFDPWIGAVRAFLSEERAETDSMSGAEV